MIVEQMIGMIKIRKYYQNKRGIFVLLIKDPIKPNQ